MMYFTKFTLTIFIVLFIGKYIEFLFRPKSGTINLLVIILGFFAMAACLLKFLHERRLRARLQQELNGLLYDYVPMDGNEIETISFINLQSHSQQNAGNGQQLMEKV